MEEEVKLSDNRDENLRLECLRLASKLEFPNSLYGDDVVQAANNFYKFIKKGE